MKKLLIFTLLLSFGLLIAGSRYFDTADIPFPRAFEPFLENHLENYLVPQTTVGNYWFVDSGNTASNTTGKSWDKAFTSIATALTYADDDDVIFVAPGDYVVTTAITVTEDNLKIIGCGNINSNAVLIYNSDNNGEMNLMTINANNVEISGIGFTTVNDSCSAIRVATTASAYKVWINNCRFDGYAQGDYAIHTGTTYDSPDILVENCLFRSFGTASIYANATRGVYRNNIFHVDAATIGIEHVPNAGSRPDQLYYNNVILGANSTDTGIKITNTPSAGTYMIVRNIVLNCNTSITGKATNDAACALNYVGDASGGALINPSP